MMFSKKKKLDRRNSIMVAVKKELKANNAYIAPEALQKLAEKLYTSYYYDIEVIRDADVAAKRLQLIDHEEVYYVESEGENEEGEVVYGCVKFGKDYFYHNIEDEDVQCCFEDSDFELNEAFIVIIENRKWADGYDDCETTTKRVIVLYSPEKIMDDETYEATKNTELDKICQLRESKYNLPKAE